MSSSTRSTPGQRPSFEAQPTPRQFGTSLGTGGGAGVLAALLVFLGARAWYPLQVKPLWAPPGWTLALVQLLVFVLMGAALAFLQASRAPEARKKVVRLWFTTQLLLGLLWSLCFFALGSAGLGYTVALLWWCAVIALLWTGSRLSRRALWLLVPLWAWVTFASSLNFAILSFNVLRQVSAQMDADPRNANSPIDPTIIVKKK